MEMKKILVKDVLLLTMVEGTDPDQELKKGNILINNQLIEAVGDFTYNADEVEIVDGKDCVALPGLINCHTHAAMTLLRGYADDMELMPWLEEKIWPREAKLNNESIYWGTMLANLEMIKSGTTTFADMYFFMDEVAQATLESGMRAVLARGLIGFNDNEGKNLQESCDFIRTWQGQGQGRISCMLGPHAPYTCPPEYLEKVIETAKDLQVGLHIHLAETQKEFTDLRKQFGQTPIEFVNNLGLLDLPVNAAHCVHLTEEDVMILKEKNVGVAHNPSSNMKLASGMAPVPHLLEVGINVGLGTDGTASNNNLNMWEEMHMAALLHKVSWGDPTLVPASQVLKMGTTMGANVLNIQNEVGSIEVGKKADIILLDLNKPHLVPQHSLVANLIYSAQGSDVKTTIIDGKIVMKNREVLTLDEERVMYEAQKAAEKLIAD
jgi:5-methylthioadenosine/S-adenosylhomocysteine deaminase